MPAALPQTAAAGFTPVGSITAGPPPIGWTAAGMIWLMGTAIAAVVLQDWLSTSYLATQFISPPVWTALVPLLGGQLTPLPDQPVPVVDVPFLGVLIPVLVLSGASWLIGAWLIDFANRPTRGTATATIGNTWPANLNRWAWSGWRWWCLFGLWEVLWIIVNLFEWEAGQSLLIASLISWLAICLGGWAGDGLLLWLGPEQSATPLSTWFPPKRVLWLAIAVYLTAFLWMNFSLYFNLRVPHGDSVMYEEHLWNLLHGKGFRSYLDPSTFLGEHIQFVHVLLLPIYAIWPSHLTLETCESLGLALAAWPIYWMAKRHSGSERWAVCLSLAYLSYPLLHFLDIAADQKSFRPEAFGIPLLLLALERLDAGRLYAGLGWLALTLAVKEDLTLVWGPLGLWIAGCGHFLQPPSYAAADLAVKNATRTSIDSNGHAIVSHDLARWQRQWVIAGLAVSVWSVTYLLLATRVLIPWFRGGDVHFASYYSRYGQTFSEVLWTLITQPWRLSEAFGTIGAFNAATVLLVAQAGLALAAPARLLVAAPLFAVLCLNPMTIDPRHHFFAPLIPLMFWAAAAVLHSPARLPIHPLHDFGREVSRWTMLALQLRASAVKLYVLVPRLMSRWWPRVTNDPGAKSARALTMALAMGLSLSFWPFSEPFWDPGSTYYWKTLYWPDARAEAWAAVPSQIPLSAKVASTDFVHPRFTHHARSYDYSDYKRKVAGWTTNVPDDTDYIVIDTGHPYSSVKSPAEVRELRDSPDEWELLPDKTSGYFLILKRVGN